MYPEIGHLVSVKYHGNDGVTRPGQSSILVVLGACNITESIKTKKISN